MTSNPPQPTPEWATSGPASSAPLDARPAAAGGFQAAADRFQMGPQDRLHTATRDGFRTGPQDRVPGAQSADRPAPGTGQQPRVGARRPRESASQPGPAEPGDERLATISYLAVPFLGPLVPLAVYLLKMRASGYVRSHSAQALNLSITTLLYTVCALILGTVLALDNVVVALIVAVPVAVALWLITLGYVIVAGSAANRGDYYPIPAWLCATVVR
jgi:uncharacterized Tic20 family protein